MDNNFGLNQKQKAFADFYYETGNAAESARLAGYESENNNYNQIGYRLKTNEKIQEYIEYRKEHDNQSLVEVNKTLIVQKLNQILLYSENESNQLKAIGHLMDIGGFRKTAIKQNVEEVKEEIEENPQEALEQLLKELESGNSESKEDKLQDI